MGNLGSGYMFFKVEAQRVREPGPDFHTIMSIKKNDGHYSHGTGRKQTDGLKKPLTLNRPRQSFRRYLTRSSSVRLCTRANSLILLVTRVAPTDTVCPAIAVSFGPIGVPAALSTTLMSVAKYPA